MHCVCTLLYVLYEGMRTHTYMIARAYTYRCIGAIRANDWVRATLLRGPSLPGPTSYREPDRLPRETADEEPRYQGPQHVAVDLLYEDQGRRQD